MNDGKQLVKIGQLAKLAGILPSKIRYYIKEGLINPMDRTRGGYYLFNKSQALDRLKFIDKLKNEDRLTLIEIQERLKTHMEK